MCTPRGVMDFPNPLQRREQEEKSIQMARLEVFSLFWIHPGMDFWSDECYWTPFEALHVVSYLLLSLKDSAEGTIWTACHMHWGNPEISIQKCVTCRHRQYLSKTSVSSGKLIHRWSLLKTEMLSLWLKILLHNICTSLKQSVMNKIKE